MLFAKKMENTEDLISFEDSAVILIQTTTPLPNANEGKPSSEDSELLEFNEGNDLISFENARTLPPEEKPTTADDATEERDTAPDPTEQLLQEIVQEEETEVFCAKKPYTASLDTLSVELKKFLTDLRDFFTDKINYQRKELPVSSTTIDKNIQRTLGYIGYCQRSGAEFTICKFNDVALIEEYVGYLQVARAVTPSTAVNHLVALTYPIKFMHKSEAPSYKGVPSLLSVRELMRYLNKEDARRKHQTEGSMQKWEHWPKIVAAVKRFEGEPYGKTKHEVRSSFFIYTYIFISISVFLAQSQIC